MSYASACELAEAGDFAQAAEAFAQATDGEPGHAMEALAQCLLELEDAEAAAAAALKACRAAPLWAVARLTLGRACLNAGRFAEAVVRFEQALGLDDGLQGEIGEDLSEARRLALLQDEKELIISGVKMRIQQWRGDDAVEDIPCPRAESPSQRSGTGTLVWECGAALAMFLEHQGHAPPQEQAALDLLAPFSLRGRGVLELGSGTGVAGLAAAALGANVVLSDLPEVAQLTRANVAFNSAAIEAAGGSARVVELDWNAFAPAGAAGGEAEPEAEPAAGQSLVSPTKRPKVGPPSAAEGCTLILGADLLYTTDASQVPALANLLALLLRPTRTGDASDVQVLLAHKSRHAALDDAMMDEMQSRGVQLQRISRSLHHPDFRSLSISIFAGRWSEPGDGPNHTRRLAQHVEQVDLVQQCWGSNCNNNFSGNWTNSCTSCGR